MTKPRREYRSAAAPAREKRAGLSGDLELRSRDGKPLVVGYSVKWGKLSLPIGGLYQERVERGAFAKSLKQVAAGELDLVATLNHDPNLVLGRTGNGTLKVVEDEVGLRWEATPPETTWAADMLVQLERKDHRGCSFGFECKKDGQRWDFGAGTGGMDVRTLIKVELAEVAACTFPQYDDTSLALEYRSQAQEEGSMPIPTTRAGYVNGRPLYPAWEPAAEREWTKANPGSTRSCFHGHLGVYLMHPATLTDQVALIRTGVVRPVEASHGDGEQKPRLPYELTDRGVAVVRMEGTLKKEASKYGGTGTVQTQRHLKAALRNADVRAILLVADSPGGHVDGTKELADVVAAISLVKPLHGFGEDMVASACYWIMAQTSRLSGNATGQWGSIGAVGVITDTTGAFKKEGVKVHVVATGPLKGAGTPGTPITEEHLAEVREYVMAVHGFFQAAVMAGRKMDQAAVDAVSDGRVWIASDAVGLGLMDKVETYEAALEACAVAGEKDALSLGLPPAGGTQTELKGGMTLADAARRQQLSEAGTAGLGLLSERMQAVSELSPAQMTVLEILAEEEGDDAPPPPKDDTAAEGDDDDDPGLEDPLDEPEATGDDDDVDAEGDDDDVDAEGDDDDVDAEGDDDEVDAEGDDDDQDGMEPHPALGSTADRGRRQRLARAMGDDDDVDAEGDDDDVDPTLEEDDELAEGTDDDEPGATGDDDDVDAEGDDDEVDAEGDDDEVDAEGDDDDVDAEGTDDDVDAEGTDDDEVDAGYEDDDPAAPPGNRPADPGPDGDTSNPGEGDDQQTQPGAEGDDGEAGELVEDDDEVDAEGDDDQAPEAKRRQRQRRAERT